MKTKKFFIITVITMMVLTAGSVWAATLEVPSSYATIQLAITAANIGDVINVAAGTYTEQVTINKSLSLIGAGESTTTIQCPTSGRSTVSQANAGYSDIVWDYVVAAYPSTGTIDVKIQGFTIDANAQTGSSSQNFAGVFLRDVGDGTSDGLYSSTINNFGSYGSEWSGTYGTWMGNYGVVIYDSELTIDDNDIDDYTVSGISAKGDNVDLTITSNDLDGTDCDDTGLLLCTGVATISGNNIHHHQERGIYLYETTGTTIDNSTSSNTIADNKVGLLGYDTDSAIIDGNTFTNNSERSIYLQVDSDNNVIKDNTITMTGAGVENAIAIGSGSGGNVIGGTTVADGNSITIPSNSTSAAHMPYVIHIATGGDNDVMIQNNTITNGARGVQIDGGNSGTYTISDNEFSTDLLNSGNNHYAIGVNSGNIVATNNTMVDTQRPFECFGAGTVTFTGNTLSGANFFGLNLGSYTGNPVVTGNAFLGFGGNGNVVWNQGGGDVDATSNWFGDLDPSDNVNNSGSGSLDYSPWWGANYVGDDHSSAWTWYTDDVIQEAIDVVTAGDVINVAAGIYTEQVTIPASLTGLTINGNNAGISAGATPGSRNAETVITGGFYVTGSSTVIDGFTIQQGYNNGSHKTGVVPSATNIEILNNIIKDCGTLPSVVAQSDAIKIVTGSADNLLVKNNDIINNWRGMYLTTADGIIIEGNAIHANNGVGVGIGSDTQSNLTLTGNDIYNHTLEGWGISSVGVNVVAEDNSFLTNGVSVAHYSGSAIDATSNYWGPNGPESVVSGNVAYIPWWADEAMTIVGGQPVTNQTQNTSYATIQAAIDAAAAGDVIYVAVGTYAEQLTVDEEVTLNGANVTVSGTGTRGAESIIDLSGFTLDGISVTVDNVTIDGFEIIGIQTDFDPSSNLNPTIAAEANYVTVQNCIFSTTGGIYGKEAMVARFGINHISFLNNYVNDYIYGITARANNWGGSATLPDDGVEDLTISGNTFNVGYLDTGSKIYGMGVQIQYGDRIVVSGNTINGPGTFATCSYDLINSIGIVDFMSGYGVGGTITYNDNEVTDCYVGIGTFAGDGQISNNTVTGNNTGIQVGQEDGVYINTPATGVAITGNDIFSNSVGIDVQNFDVDGLTAHYNKIYSNSVFGVQNSDTNEFDATRNYWGAADGPHNTSNPLSGNGSGNNVSAFVDFMPWYATATTTPATEFATLNGDYSTDAIITVFTSDELADALSNAGDGDEIILGSGTFTGNFVVGYDITITAADGAVPTIIGTDGGPALTINVDGVSVSGVNIEAYAGDQAVFVSVTVSDGATVSVTDGSIVSDVSGGGLVNNATGGEVVASSNYWGDTNPTGNVTGSVDNSDPILNDPVLISVSPASYLVTGGVTAQYDVNIGEVANIRGFQIKIMMDKTDFDAPVAGDFTIGSLLSNAATAASTTTTFFVDDMTGAEDDYYTWRLTGSISGVASASVASPSTGQLFYLDLTSSTGVTNLDGSNLSLGFLYARDETNGTIPCDGVTGGVVTIDSVVPDVDDITDAENGYYATAPVISALGYSDNYNVATFWYQIDATTGSWTEISGTASGSIPGTTWAAADWTLPDFAGLSEGSHTVYFRAIDQAGNTSANKSWQFNKDTTAPVALAWKVCACNHYPETSVDSNNSIELQWDDPTETYSNIHIWRKAYSDFVTNTGYPEYTGTAPCGVIVMPADPKAAEDLTNGWTKITKANITSFTNTISERGYYYYAIYVEGLNGMASDPSVVSPALSYWLGDVNAAPDGVVTSADISLFSYAWNTTTSGSILDVGPTCNCCRNGLPTPDGAIGFEDLMIFAMNYENTCYTFYRNLIPDPVPIEIELQYEQIENQIIAELILSENTGFVKGFNIPVSYGSGLVLESVQSGTIWPEGSFFIHTNNDNVVELSGSVLSSDSCIQENGVIATIIFQVTGQETSMELQQMTARTFDNQEIEILGNPITGNDPNTIIPVKNILSSNYPNPFNPSTTIRFGLNKEEMVNITIYNVRGQKVKTLIDHTMPAGQHQITWDGKDDNSRFVGSGIYFYKMETKEYRKVRKALLLK